MYSQVEKSKENKSGAGANSALAEKGNEKQGAYFVDSRMSGRKLNYPKIIGKASNIAIQEKKSPISNNNKCDVIQRGHGYSTGNKKTEQTIPKLKSYLESQKTEHSSEKDELAKRYIELLEKWKQEGSITQYWLTNQSNVLEFQDSEYKQIGGACSLIVKSFLRQARKSLSLIDGMLDRFHEGDISESLLMEADLDSSAQEIRNLQKRIDENLAVISIKMSEPKRDEDEIRDLLLKNIIPDQAALDLKIKSLEDKVMNEVPSSKMEFNCDEVVSALINMADGAYEIRLLKTDNAGHSLGIAKTKDATMNGFYYFMDPSTVSFNGNETIMERIKEWLIFYQQSGYARVSIVKYE